MGLGGRGPGIVIGIDGEWDDGEPPGMEWTTYLEIQPPDGEIVSLERKDGHPVLRIKIKNIVHPSCCMIL